ncbi:molybdopterin binding aldehyde oxidase/xanthine dehydrogenase [Russula earlei]|uniref:Molybdopterin binding aldehyde oxidase/xanthine dehydrogenase n=1 Tax=Russula earlei TaxID=71964 RepID=A0ACC0TZP1_9AGAM|nr:molybdopterin binding aldehyde oxidase/xanthine dehydrogenase [Russula earlei]
MLLLDFVRYHRRLTGTKIGCREGDCGACTVLLGELTNEGLHYHSVTSCLTPIGNINGKHVVTIEGINMPEGLNPIQAAMKEESATQCGFCTPGFIMSLTGFCLSHKAPSIPNVIAAIDGNICRCTGYKSIERAAARVAQLLQERKEEAPEVFAAQHHLLPAWFEAIPKRLRVLSFNLDGHLHEKDRPQLVGGGTDLYVQKHDAMRDASIRFTLDDTSLKGITREGNTCIIGAATTVTELNESAILQAHFPAWKQYIKLISSTPIRNIATIAGNIVNASPIGDLTVLLLALDATVVLRKEEEQREVLLQQFYKGYKQLDKQPEEYVEQVRFELPDDHTRFHFEKISKRTHLDIASVNTAICVTTSNGVISKARLSAGGVGPTPALLRKTSSYLEGKQVTVALVHEAIEMMQAEIAPISDARGTAAYKRLLLGQLIKAHFLQLFPELEAKQSLCAFVAKTYYMKNIDSNTHVRGESIYLDDMPVLEGTLYAAAFDSPVAHGKLIALDMEAALQTAGVVRILTCKDVTGENQIGGIVQDEPLFADHHVHFCGMPIALVIAETVHAAREAVKKIKATIEPLPVITDPRVAAAQGELIIPPRTFKLGDSTHALQDCAYVFSGVADTNGQEHLYIETQGAYAVPLENGVVRVYSSTQAPTAVQRCITKVLGISMHQVEVDVTRLGGGFGGKEDQANTWAALCALGTHLLRRPVKYSLDRMEDMRMTGKRHPYSSDFTIGLDKEYRIIAFEASLYQNAGAAADLSPAVLERSLFHCTNSYGIPHVTATAYCCRTHLPPNTAFRGFGGPQGMFVIEAAIAKAADELGIDAAIIQQRNLLRTGDELSYGQKVVSEAHECWNKAAELYQLDTLKKEIAVFNQQHTLYKKGLAVMPICFGISFTNTLMNQGRSLVHVYTDGSVVVSTGAVEMGQGVNTKMVQVAAHVFSIAPDKVKVNSTNTYRIANTSPTAASATADLNGRATQIACTAILERLKEVAANEFQTTPEAILLKEECIWVNGVKTEMDWKKLVMTAYMKRVSLSEHGHYATPEIKFDKTKEKGHPFAYHVYGTAIITATIDCLRGTYIVDSVKVVHDFGSSMNKAIDLGQIEGGIVQGIGWMTLEEIVYDTNGKLRSNALSTYKVPDIYSVPKEISIEFLETDKDNLAIFKSKAVGEPPLMYGIGAYFALRNAIKAFNPNTSIGFNAPLTPEKVLMNLYERKEVVRYT